ncbi:nitrogen regulatory protein P-II family [Amphibacillus marinus]|uniref:Nitrogen regulatory protein P-II family n=1 Tax=Amphibacillus marinus TaxID=872970 RepID=A0A1H8GRU1_9BACI|nr:P-II family nitrogen regulator [Amphibacillus marinus]SEN46565.1 nitrogen regulatory protein P-II family [Amphibacillus marinus]
MIERIEDHKLIVTIVKKDKANKIINATRKAGAQGGTTVIGSGFHLKEKKRFLGIPVPREREVIFTIVSEVILSEVLSAIDYTIKLDKSAHGIAFVIDIKKVTGISHLIGDQIVDCSREENLENMAESVVKQDLIVTIVNNGDAEDVVDASKNAGATGGTIIHGRGTGVHEKAMLFNIMIEPEKEVVLTLVTRAQTTEVLSAINKAIGLTEPGKGVAFVLEVENTIGMNLALKEEMAEEFKNN